MARKSILLKDPRHIRLREMKILVEKEDRDALHWQHFTMMLLLYNSSSLVPPLVPVLSFLSLPNIVMGYRTPLM